MEKRNYSHYQPPFISIMKIIDRYIVKKFLGTFFLSIALIVLIAVIFDISEKLEDFISRKAPLKAIIFDYYFNFIPYFANLFSPLFIFISVIYFTSRMAGNTEIIAILSAGISFNRMLRPYLLVAGFLAILSLILNNFVIPVANQKRLAFEEAYIRNPYRFFDRDIHRRIDPNTFVYFESFNNLSAIGYKFSIERFEGNNLVYKLNADFAQYDTITGNWKIHNFVERTFLPDGKQIIHQGLTKDTVLYIDVSEFYRRENTIEQMNYFVLNEFIEKERFKGSLGIEYYEIEKQKRIAFPFSAFVLTIIGVSIASRKVRGGTGAHLGLGIALSFSYILLMQVSTTFSTNAGLTPWVSVWIPNFLYGILAIYLLQKTPK